MADLSSHLIIFNCRQQLYIDTWYLLSANEKGKWYRELVSSIIMLPQKLFNLHFNILASFPTFITKERINKPRSCLVLNLNVKA